MVHMNGRTVSAMYMVNNILLERYMTLVESLKEMQRRVKLAKRKSGSFLTQFTAGKAEDKSKESVIMSVRVKSGF